MRKVMIALIVVQSLALAALVFWWLYPRGTAGSGRFDAVMEVVRARGPGPAVELLGRDVLRAGIESCHQEACAVALHGEDVTRWQAAMEAGGRDRCAGFQSPRCTRRSVEAELARVLQQARLHECREGPLTSTLRGPVQTVQCRGFQDAIPLAPAAGDGGYVMLGVPEFPGFLRNVYVRHVEGAPNQ